MFRAAVAIGAGVVVAAGLNSTIKLTESCGYGEYVEALVFNQEANQGVPCDEMADPYLYTAIVTYCCISMDYGDYQGYYLEVVNSDPSEFETKTYYFDTSDCSGDAIAEEILSGDCQDFTQYAIVSHPEPPAELETSSGEYYVQYLTPSQSGCEDVNQIQYYSMQVANVCESDAIAGSAVLYCNTEEAQWDHYGLTNCDGKPNQVLTSTFSNCDYESTNAIGETYFIGYWGFYCHE